MIVTVAVIEDVPTQAGLDHTMSLLATAGQVAWVARERVVLAIQGDTAAEVYGRMRDAQARGGSDGRPMTWRPPGVAPTEADEMRAMLEAAAAKAKPGG